MNAEIDLRFGRKLVERQTIDLGDNILPMRQTSVLGGGADIGQGGADPAVFFFVMKGRARPDTSILPG